MLPGLCQGCVVPPSDIRSGNPPWPSPFWSGKGWTPTWIRSSNTTLATRVESVQVSDATPSHAEVEATVCRLHPFTVGGHTHLHAYHFKQWMLEAYPGRTRRPPSRPSDGCVWWKLFNTCGSRGDSSGVGVHCLGTHTQRYHIHLGNRPTGDPL